MRGQRDRSFFDDKHAVMEHGSAEPGVRRCCYAEQATAIESVIPGGVVVDVGCGPALPYRRSEALVPDRLRHVVRIAARPSLKIPRLLFDVHLYHWTV